VIGGPSVRDPASPSHVTNPKLIVEVLSPGTGGYDRNEKLEHYKRITSLVAFVLVDHRSELFELWTRTTEQEWSHGRFLNGEQVPLNAIQCTLSVDALYRVVREFKRDVASIFPLATSRPPKL